MARIDRFLRSVNDQTSSASKTVGLGTMMSAMIG
jgi:hypothetical protein